MPKSERTKPRIAISTLGCKTNFYESAVIAQSFGDIELVDFDQNADIYIINTCTVTNRTDYKSRNLIRKALAFKSDRPSVKVVVTGCFAQRSFEEICALGAVDLVVDNQNKLDIADILAGKENHFTDIMDATDFAYKPVDSMLGHTRAFQKIQDGCDFYCAYCAVPYARGHSRSARFPDVIEQAKLFAANGFKEIVLGGVNLGLYKCGDKDLADVVTGIAEIQDIELIRISSIEPQLLSTGLLQNLKAVEKLCPHFHIPLQSGSDSILKNMGRHYNTLLIKELVDSIISYYPDSAIGFDVICGFPAESDELFDETYQFLQSLPIAYLHVFPYSKRKDTKAEKMPGHLPNIIKSRRVKALTELSNSKRLAYITRLRDNGTVCRGINESTSSKYAEILSDHYIRLRIPGTYPQGTLVNCNIRDCEVQAN
ncbi:MAG: tRNA (N(6)-L-threonylcarbamoyladenosine(37)-C(2))-methylthiotransferase MtaB [Candidatus Cloacimonetes bacterium]|nr:tRNA (N(6)-L-threonylcarbamoyladenosine(37)-C(2))-methylthiotransferase MtaB [Candidatus Cloacimonadota bacterium]MDD2506511.1 tRNA (N(6)-L-threonylcarbamoyladenosine(37)-C(2))-methylthiotransferase MtaB [Candidatus Cloacimonadota bacterium]MDD4147400.1 tRNA (N(6)-L-threonylcarbamoyladenosine(37)-C(2))-methylthiotransferase MtaB [Candidatus Cloacimonadota bacterium]MDD4559851.1 tRNA (N(6)-L-threonylcarbamoyladenosine(37)-C(2))-methylthiotransferase MtaB [Candidatus Cloacimonadota bacterium]